jgi:hypothetical protein
MSSAIPPLPNTPSWRRAQLKQRDNFTFTFNIILPSMPTSIVCSLYFTLYRLADQISLHDVMFRGTDCLYTVYSCSFVEYMKRAIRNVETSQHYNEKKGLEGGGGNKKWT